MLFHFSKQLPLIQTEGYLNCYVAQLFMPWNKNACLLLRGKVTHYNPSYFPPSLAVVVGPSECLSATSHQERGASFLERAPEDFSCRHLSDVTNRRSLSLSLGFPLKHAALFKGTSPVRER